MAFVVRIFRGLASVFPSILLHRLGFIRRGFCMGLGSRLGRIRLGMNLGVIIRGGGMGPFWRGRIRRSSITSIARGF